MLNFRCSTFLCVATINPILKDVPCIVSYALVTYQSFISTEILLWQKINKSHFSPSPMQYHHSSFQLRKLIEPIILHLIFNLPIIITSTILTPKMSGQVDVSGIDKVLPTLLALGQGPSFRIPQFWQAGCRGGIRPGWRLRLLLRTCYQVQLEGKYGGPMAIRPRKRWRSLSVGRGRDSQAPRHSASETRDRRGCYWWGYYRCFIQVRRRHISTSLKEAYTRTY